MVPRTYRQMQVGESQMRRTKHQETTCRNSNLYGLLLVSAKIAENLTPVAFAASHHMVRRGVLHRAATHSRAAVSEHAARSCLARGPKRGVGETCRQVAMHAIKK